MSFLDNYNQTFTFTATAPNGKSSEVVLNGVTVIDKTAPEVADDDKVEIRYNRKGTVVNSGADAYKVVVAIYPSEPVTSANYGETELYQGELQPIIYNPNYPLEITFTHL